MIKLSLESRALPIFSLVFAKQATDNNTKMRIFLPLPEPPKTLSKRWRKKDKATRECLTKKLGRRPRGQTSANLRLSAGFLWFHAIECVLFCKRCTSQMLCFLGKRKENLKKTAKICVWAPFLSLSLSSLLETKEDIQKFEEGERRPPWWLCAMRAFCLSQTHVKEELQHRDAPCTSQLVLCIPCPLTLMTSQAVVCYDCCTRKQSFRGPLAVLFQTAAPWV